MTKDYDTVISAEICHENVFDNVYSGSIIIFFDSNKAKDNLLKSLGKTIETL